MSRMTFPNILAKIGLTTDKSRLHVATAAAQSVLPQMIIMTPVETMLPAAKTKGKPKTGESTPVRASIFKRTVDFMHRYWLGVFALLFLLIGVLGIRVGAAYWTAHEIKPITVTAPVHHRAVPLRGPNMAVPADQLTATLQQITGQPINLTVGAKTVPVDSTTIKSWLHIVTDKKTGTSYIHLNQDKVAPSLDELISKYAKSPVNQVTVTHPDGSSAVVVAGRDGTSVGNPDELAKQLAPNVLGSKGMQLAVPLGSVPFQAVTAAAFDKLIEVNVASKQMYLYDKGNFTRQYAISAGAPETPTPIGQFKIYSKLTVQDMKGFNPDGSKYLQPHVRWINYFLPGGYAVHGNYWRPASVFGAVNTSHGCVSLPEDQAKWIFDWAPIGTTVITHT